MYKWINGRPVYPNELYHYGIKGMSWGVRNGPPYPLTTSSYSKFLSKGDKSYNLDKWGTSRNTNCLYITGYSGSGKSSLAKQLGKHAEIIELDHYLCDPKQGTANRAFDAYLAKNNPGWSKITKNFSKWDGAFRGDLPIDQEMYFWRSRDQLLTKDVPNFARQQYGKSKVICEGVQLMSAGDYGDTGKIGLSRSSPVIIKGASFTKSSLRGAMRDIKADTDAGYKVSALEKAKMIYRYQTDNRKESIHNRKAFESRYKK